MERVRDESFQWLQGLQRRQKGRCLPSHSYCTHVPRTFSSPPRGRFQAGPAVCPTSRPRMDAEIGPSFLNLHGGFLLCYSNPLTPRG